MDDQTNRADLIVKHAGPSGLEDYNVDCENCGQDVLIMPKSPKGFYMIGVMPDKYPKGNGVRYCCDCPHCGKEMRPDVTSKVRQRNSTGDVRKPETFRGLVRGNLWDSVPANFTENTAKLAEVTRTKESEYQARMQEEWGDHWMEVEMLAWQKRISMEEACKLVYKGESDGS
jgi:ssDNA-binding Zn-finger/Zn-ribbon topoisomerase 1